MTRLHVLNVTYMILISLILPAYPGTMRLKSSSHPSLHFSILRGGRIKKRARLFQGKHSLTFEMQPKLEQFQRLESDYKNTKWLTASHDRFWWFCWLHISSDIASQCSCMHLPVCDLVLHIFFGPKCPLWACQYEVHHAIPKIGTPDFLQEITKSYQTSCTKRVLIYMNINESTWSLDVFHKKTYAYITGASSLDLQLIRNCWKDLGPYCFIQTSAAECWLTQPAQ